MRSFETAQSEILGALYAASTDAARWPDFVATMSQWFHGTTGMFLRPKDDPGKTRFLGGDLDPEMQRKHDEYYIGCNPWIARIGRTHPVLDLGEAMMPIADFVKTEYYNDWLRHNGCLHWAGIRPLLGDGAQLGLGIGRPATMGEFSAEEQRLLITISDHLGRAGEIARRLDLLDTQAQAASAILSSLNAAVLLLDAGLRVAFANPLAEQLLAAGDGMVLRGGRLRLSHTRLDAALRAAVSQATLEAGQSAVPGATLSISRPSGAPPLSLTVSPLDERDRLSFAAGPLAILVIGLPDRDVSIDPERLRAAYDLTPAEARLAIALGASRTWSVA